MSQPPTTPEPYQVPRGRWHQSPTWLELSRYQRKGMLLNTSEDRALTAIQKLIYQHVTTDHERIIWQSNPDLPHNPWPDMEAPILETTRAEYLNAYGLPENASSTTAFNALYRLAGLEQGGRTEPFRIRIPTDISDDKPRPKKADKQPAVDLKRLIHIPEISRAQAFSIIPTPPLIAGLDVAWRKPAPAFFVKKENDLFTRARDFLRYQGKLGAQGELKTPTYLRFLYYLNTQAHTKKSSRPNISRTYHQIREEFNLRTLKAVVDHLQFAQNMGYLTSFEPDGDKKWQLVFNRNLFPSQE